MTFFAVALCHSAAIAAEHENRFEISPVGGYRLGGTFEIEGSDASYEIQDSSSLGLILNFRDTENTQWELLFSRQSSEARLESGAGIQPFVDLELQTLQIGGTYQGRGDTVRPYLAATIGGTRIETDAESDIFFSGSIGVGLQIRPLARLGIRLEARAHGTLTDSDTDLFCSTGPDLNTCAVQIEGDLLAQLEAFAGVVFRF
ncbi:MAG: outer membrane beta-barrel protein [Woeseiaceae bacterium]